MTESPGPPPTPAFVPAGTPTPAPVGWDVSGGVAGPGDARCEAEDSTSGYRCGLRAGHAGEHIDRARANRERVAGAAAATGALATFGAPAMGPRFVAYLGDNGLVTLVAVAIQAVPPLHSTSLPVHSVVAFLVAVVLSVGYFGWFWTRGSGATPFMRLVGLRVRGARDGASLSAGAAGRRWLALVGVGQTAALLQGLVPIAVLSSLLAIAQLGYIVVLYSATTKDPVGRGPHDRFAGSAVMRTTDRPATPVELVAVLAVAMMALALVAAVRAA